MSEEVFRGSWIPVNDSLRPELYKCPFCGEQVYIKRGMATYPTCPFCLSDMPEAEDFETPEELAAAKRGNRGATMKTYDCSKEANEAKKAKHREYYERNREKLCEYQRKYRAEHRDEQNEYQRERYKNNPEYRELKKEKVRRYRAENREAVNANQREYRKAHPEKVREYQIKSRGKSIREVKAHIHGVSVDEIPEYDFWGAKGVKQ